MKSRSSISSSEGRRPMNASPSPPRAEVLPEGTGGALPASQPAPTPARAPQLLPAPGRRLFSPSAGWLRRTAGAGARPPEVARPRRMRQGGRAVLLWALVFYAAAQLAMRCFMDAQLPPPWVQTWHEKWQQLRQLVAREPDRPLLVMLGSSRTDRALQAGGLNGLPGPDGKPFLAYNLGLPGAGPLRVGLTPREMLDAGIRPRLLLVEFLPP